MHQRGVQSESEVKVTKSSIFDISDIHDIHDIHDIQNWKYENIYKFIADIAA